MVRATIIHYNKFLVAHKFFDTEAVIELKIWKVAAGEEGIKYSLFCVNKEYKKVVIGMDNHHPKGHHVHYGAEFPIWVPGDFLKGDRPERLLAS